MKYHILTRSPHSELHAAVVIEGQGLGDLRSRVPPMNVDSEGDVSIDLREATLTFMLILVPINNNTGRKCIICLYLSYK